MSVVQVFPMRGHDAWRRTPEIRERYLAAGDPDRLPPPGCGVDVSDLDSVRAPAKEATPRLGAYSVTKYGVVALTEVLAQELAAAGSAVGASADPSGLVPDGPAAPRVDRRRLPPIRRHQPRHQPGTSPGTSREEHAG